MQTNALVTSNDPKFFDAVSKFRAAYDQSQLTPESAQILNEAAGFKEYLAAGIKRFSSSKHPQAEHVERYFREVLGYELDLSGVAFPEKEGFATFMAVPTELDEDEILNRLTAHFKVNPYSWLSPIASNIDRNRTTEQRRPQGLYVFAHRGGDEPDSKWLGKSYDDVTAVPTPVVFINPKEYLLATGFHRWQKGKFMDVKGWTRTSSLWSDGGLVRGLWLPDDSGLYLSDGGRDCCRPDGGVRELVLVT